MGRAGWRNRSSVGLQEAGQKFIEFVRALERAREAAVAEDMSTGVREKLQQRQGAVGERDDAVLCPVDQQHRYGDRGELVARERQIVDPALARGGEQLGVVRLGE